MRFGDKKLGKLARWQLDAMQNDPRGQRPRRAVIAEFWDSAWEIHGNRQMAQAGANWGVKEVEREAERLGVDPRTDNLPDDAARSLQAAWEREHVARALINSDFPWLNLQGVVAHAVALDALMEHLALEINAMALFNALMIKLKSDAPEVVEVIEAQPDEIPDLGRALYSDLLADKKIPRTPRPRGSGVDRYRDIVQSFGLGEPVVPDQMDNALAQSHVIRNIYVHRAGFVDGKARRGAPDLPFSDGEFLRLTSQQYRTYVAAIRSYVGAMESRLLTGAWPNLDDWRSNYIINS